MWENPWFYAWLSLQVVYSLKKLKYFEVISKFFELSRVWEYVESWLVYQNKLFWTAQPYFSANIIKQRQCQLLFLILRYLTVIIYLYFNETKKKETFFLHCYCKRLLSNQFRRSEKSSKIICQIKHKILRASKNNGNSSKSFQLMCP